MLAMKFTNKVQILSLFLLFALLVLRFLPDVLALQGRVVGEFSDQTTLLWHFWWEDYSHQNPSISLNSMFPTSFFDSSTERYFLNQPILRMVIKLLLIFFDRYGTYNLLIFAAFPLTALMTFLLFRSLGISAISSLVWSYAYAVSPYIVLHARSHIDLVQVWLIPLGLLALLRMYRSFQVKDLLSILVLWVIVSLISNYYGYILFIFYGFFFFFTLPSVRVHLSARKITSVFLLFIISAFSIISIFSLATHIPTQGIFLSLLGLQKIELIRSRGIEDFVIFSSRPWNYILPPPQHPALGFLATHFQSWLESSKDYFLFKNPFPSEQGGLYLGLVPFIFTFWGVRRALRLNKYSRVFLVLFGLFLLLSLPPMLTLSGHTFFLPSMILVKLFPMFRALSRFSVVTLLIWLMFSAYGFDELWRKLSSSKVKVLLAVLTLILISVEFYLPLKSFSTVPPAEYRWLASQPFATIMEYPYAAAQASQFWQPVHLKGILNTRSTQKTSFNSEKFTKNFLNSPLSEVTLEEYKVEYIVVHYSDLKVNEVQAARDYFTRDIVYAPVFEYEDVVIYSVSQNKLREKLLRTR